MLDKLKRLIEVIKSGFWYVVGPLAFIGGSIWYLFSRNQDLKDQLMESKAEKELAKVLAKKVEIDNEANKSTDDYKHLRDKYLNSRPKSDT